MGVDYYNCSECNEIYADCGDCGYCEYGYCNYNVCIGCHNDNSTVFDFTSDKDFTICNRHLEVYEESDSETESESEESEESEESSSSEESLKPKVLNDLLKYVNNKYDINLKSMKELYSYKRIEYCKECKTTDCRKFTPGKYHTNTCCVCKKRDICKSCKKEKPDNPIVLREKFINGCKNGSIETVSNIIETMINVIKTSMLQAYLIEGFNNSCIYDNVEITKLLIQKYDIKEYRFDIYEINIICAFNNASFNVIELLLGYITDVDLNNYLGYVFRKLDGPNIVVIKDQKNQKDIEKYENKYNTYRLNLFHLLVSKGANDFNFCLLNSCIYQNIELAKLSVEKGANNIKESLIIACSTSTSTSTNTSTDLINYLLSEKNKQCTDTDINTYNQCLYNLCSVNMCNMYYAVEKNKSIIPIHIHIAQFIELGANNYNECLIQACIHSNIFAVNMLINKGANNLNTAMYHVSKTYSNLDEIKKILIKHGANKFSDYR